MGGGVPGLLVLRKPLEVRGRAQVLEALRRVPRGSVGEPGRSGEVSPAPPSWLSSGLGLGVADTSLLPARAATRWKGEVQKQAQYSVEFKGSVSNP